MPFLAGHLTAFDVSPQNTSSNNYDAMYRLTISDPSLLMAISDLVSAISNPNDVPINCGRAIDGIRVMMCPPRLKRAKGWPIMREKLNLGEDYLLLITDTSTGPRHGDRTFISGDIVTNVMNRSWIIMNRYLEFRKRGEQPLSLAEFPLLVG
jgi:hypothetical protein